MNEHLDDHDTGLPRGERELTLSTGAILGIFFGLVLLCGVCFGVGYNMGRKSTPTPLAINDPASESTVATDANGTAKPPAGSPVESDTTATTATPSPSVAVAPPPAPKPAPIVRKPAPVETATATAAPTTAPSTPPPSRATEPSVAPAPRAVSPTALLPGATAGTGSIMVQVAAVSHQEDADLLVGALRSRGYVVTARSGSSDGFIHVQVGPFSDKKAAEAMRQRLLSDGYNAILK